jgi:hypothetical protein
MYVLQIHFPASNIATEYEALLHGLRTSTTLDIYQLRVLGDSLLVVDLANKEWSCLDDKMLLYCQELHKLENNILEYLHILQGKNEVVDELAKLISSRAMVPPPRRGGWFFMKELHEPGITKALAKPAKRSSHRSRFRHRLRAYMSCLKSWKFIRTSVPHSWYISGQEACQKTKMNVNNCVIGQDTILC